MANKHQNDNLTAYRVKVATDDGTKEIQVDADKIPLISSDELLRCLQDSLNTITEQDAYTSIVASPEEVVAVWNN